MQRCMITGTGSFLPGNPIHTSELADCLGRGITRLARTIGIETRHLAVDPHNGWERLPISTADMAYEAISAALESAHCPPQAVDVIVMVTSTPDYPFPATVTFVQEKLGIQDAMVFELRAACAGVTGAVALAESLIGTGRARVAVVVGAEMSSSMLDFTSSHKIRWTDDMLLSAAMFGDGAGAIVLEAAPTDEPNLLLHANMGCMGNGRPSGFRCLHGGTAHPIWSLAQEDTEHKVRVEHDFRGILKHGPTLVRRGFEQMLDATGLERADFDLIIPPQANGALTRKVLANEELDPEKVFLNLKRVGNTSSASILIALDDAIREHRIGPGALVGLVGAEASKWLYGAIAIRWPGHFEQRHHSTKQTTFVRPAPQRVFRERARLDLQALKKCMRPLQLSDGSHRQVASIGEGSPIVCLPMIDELNFVYAPQVEHFGKEHQMIVYEPLLSSTKRVSVHDRAKEVVAIMDALDLPSAHILAWSDTGSAAYVLGRDFASRVRSISFLGLADRYRFPKFLSPLMAMYEYLPIENRLPTPVLASVLSYFLGGRQVKKRWVFQWALEIENLPALFKKSVLPNLTEHAPSPGEVQAPCLLVCGDQDALVTPEQAHAMAALLPGSGKAAIVEGAEHFLGYVHEAPVNQLIRTFLTSISAKTTNQS